MAGKWRSEEDFEVDFWSMAEIPVTTPPVVSDHLRAARKTQRLINSIYLDPDLYRPNSDIEDGGDKEEEEGEVKYHRFPSRGRPLKSNMRRPGGKMSENEFFKLVQSDIRQVAGAGYSNELIEHAFKVREDNEEETRKTIHFQSATNKKSCSSSSNSTRSPFITQDKHFLPLKKGRRKV